MKRGIITLGILTLLFLNSTWGQLASRIRAYSETTVSDVHISVYKSPFSTFLYYKEAGTNRDVFIYKNKKYIMPIIANPNGSIKYSVNDMKVAGDCCFFCGEMTIPTDHYILPPILDRTASFDKKGYIACLYLDSIEDPYNPNVRCRFCLIDNTIEMTKMAIYSYSSDTAIAMIGKYDNSDRTSCLVSVVGIGSSWQNSVYYFTDTTETLTDITITDKSLVTASRFGGENYTFGVRYVNLSDFYNDNITEYQTLNKFNTVNMVDNPDHLQVTWHRNYATIRLIAMPNSNDVTLAHESHRFSGQQGEFYSYFSLYYINGSNPYNISMSYARRIPCCEYPVEVFKDMQYVPINDQIALLENHPSLNYQGAIPLFSWNNTTLNDLASQDFDMTAMVITANKYIWTGGTNQTNNCIYQHNQDISSTATCLRPGSNQSRTMSPLPDNIQSTTDVKKKYKNNMEWIYKSRVVPFITQYEIKCQNLLLDQ